MRRNEEMLASEKRRLEHLVGDLVLSLGGRRTERGSYSFAMDTPLGHLLIYPSDGAVYCRFADPQLASKFGIPESGLSVLLFGISLNPFSGKWNHHYFERITADEALAEFEWAFRQVVAGNMKFSLEACS